MHLLPGYQSSDYICKAFIICLPSPKNYRRDLNKKLQLKQISRFKTEAQFTYELCYTPKQQTVLKPTDCKKLKELPLGNNCLFNEMEFNFIAVPLGSDHVNLNVHDYI